MSDKGVFRRAPATPVLIININSFKFNKNQQTYSANGEKGEKGVRQTLTNAEEGVGGFAKY